ncbi:MAG: hypothetical protein GX777_03215 [Fastidiosipila sp.]|nr:hypothetical protein [Fastidiosipila sp.]
MKRKGSVKELISQLVILGLFAAVLYFIYSQLSGRPELSNVRWLHNIFYFAVVIFAIMFLLFLRQFFSNHALERYDPGSPESLQRLSKLRRFKLAPKYKHLQQRWKKPLEDIKKFFYNDDYNLVRSDHFDFIFERERKILSPWRGRRYIKRSFVFYHPMLNVLIVDQKLKQAERWIDHYWDQAPSDRNFFIFITDMENFEEISSAGAGVVNFLGTMKQGSLYPVLIDMDGGRYFFPVDLSILKRRDRLLYYYKRWQIKRLIKKSVADS